MDLSSFATEKMGEHAWTPECAIPHYDYLHYFVLEFLAVKTGMQIEWLLKYFVLKLNNTFTIKG